MRARIALTIFGKEFLETLRDRRAMATMVLLPIVLYPSLIVISSQVMTHEVARLQGRRGRVAVIGELPPDMQALAESNNMEFVAFEETPVAPASLAITPPSENDEDNPWMRFDVDVPEALTEWAAQRLADRRVELVVVVPTNLPALLTSGRTAPVALLQDETIDVSRIVSDRFYKQLVRWRYRLRDGRRRELAGLPEGFFYPVVIQEETTADSEKRGGFIAGRIIPFVLVMMMLVGAFLPAVDLTAGEKERGTIQTLLTAPTRATEIILGKFMAVFSVAMITAAANLLSMAMAIAWLLNSVPNSEEMALTLAPGTAFLILVQLVPIAVFMSALMLAVAVFAQSFKEAQNYLTPVVFVVLVPTSMAMLLSVNLDPLTACAPILNFVLLTRELLVKPPAAGLVLIVLASNSVYAAVALGVAVRVFQNERVLLGGSVGQRAPGRWFSRNLSRPPTPALSMGVFALGFLVLLFVGSPLQRYDLVSGMLITQWGLLGLPALLIARGLGRNWRDLLALRRPNAHALTAGVLLGLSAFLAVGYPVSALQNRFLPMPEVIEAELEKLLGLGTEGVSTGVMLFVYALSPAICEEMFFRGLIMSGFRGRLGKWTTIVATGVLFGVFHVSIYRMFPTAVLGVLLSWLVFEARSLWPGIVLHALNNGAALLIGRYAGPEALEPSASGWPLPAAAMLVFATGLLFAHRARKD
jgi:sodium transport system permease protein